VHPAHLLERDEVVETFIFDGLHESLGVWIAVWTLRVRSLIADAIMAMTN
jgi:hypothetical protein